MKKAFFLVNEPILPICELPKLTVMIRYSTEICNKLNHHSAKVSEKLGSKIIDLKGQSYLKYLGERLVSSIVLRPTGGGGLFNKILKLGKHGPRGKKKVGGGGGREEYARMFKTIYFQM